MCSGIKCALSHAKGFPTLHILSLLLVELKSAAADQHSFRAIAGPLAIYISQGFNSWYQEITNLTTEDCVRAGVKYPLLLETFRSPSVVLWITKLMARYH